MGLYEWRFRISLAGAQPVSGESRRQHSFRHVQWPSGTTWALGFVRSWQACGRFCTAVRTYCF